MTAAAVRRFIVQRVDFKEAQAHQKDFEARRAAAAETEIARLKAELAKKTP